jgi:hypothetical protein
MRRPYAAATVLGLVLAMVPVLSGAGDKASDCKKALMDMARYDNTIIPKAERDVSTAEKRLEKCEADLAAGKVRSCSGVKAQVRAAKEMVQVHKKKKAEIQAWFQKSCS